MPIHTMEFTDDEITPALGRMYDAVDDMSLFMTALAGMMVASTQDRMLRGEQPDGQPFAPRSPVTLEQYAKNGFSFGGPLHYSRRLVESIYPESGPDYARIGTNVEQAAVMQFGASHGDFGETDRGGPIPWGDIPARPFMGISDDDRTNIMAELAEWLQTAVDG